MPISSPLTDQPAERTSGFCGRRERTWGLVGGTVGAVVGLGSFLVSRLVPETSLRELAGSPYPPILARRGMIALDYYFLALVLVGLVFLGGALVVLRMGRYPRSDGYGAVLLGSILSALGGCILFLRVWAIVHG
jgi:hypothetical protein